MPAVASCNNKIDAEKKNFKKNQCQSPQNLFLELVAENQEIARKVVASIEPEYSRALHIAKEETALGNVATTDMLQLGWT